LYCIAATDTRADLHMLAWRASFFLWLIFMLGMEVSSPSSPPAWGNHSEVL
jgi:hypothetical protein